MLKQLSKNLLTAGAAKLPWGAREALLQALSDRVGPSEMYSRAATALGIRTWMASGEYGLIQSSGADGVVLPSYARTGVWARQTVQLFKEFFAETGGTYIDIGANIGLTAIPVAQNSRVNCIAFEPDPTNFVNLAANVARNVADSNVVLHQVAVFDRETTLKFRVAKDGNLGDHRVALADVRNDETIEVRAKALQSFSAQITQPLGIKVDAQGAEPYIVAGGSEIFERAGLLALEFSPSLMENLNADPRSVIAMISNYTTVAIVQGDSDEDLNWLSSDQAYDRLHKFVNERVGNAYLDIYARR